MVEQAGQPQIVPKRVTVRLDFADGTSNELVVDDPTNWLWSISGGDRTAVMERDGGEWRHVRDVRPRTASLELSWDEAIADLSPSSDQRA